MKKLLSLLLLVAVPALAQNTGSTGGGQSFDNRQPTLAVQYIICTQGIFPSRFNPGIAQVDRTTPLLAEIRAVAFGSPIPSGWTNCAGQTLVINQNSALFSLLGTTYGGNGTTTFQLPNLSGRVPIGAGQGPGLSNYDLGQTNGTEQMTLASNNLPAHVHGTSSANTGSAGSGAAFNNLQPSLAVNYLITESGEITMFGGNFAPDGWAFCNGQLVAIADQPTLFNYIGVTYGGDGSSVFSVPDLRGRAPVGIGQGSGLSNYALGQAGGVESVTLTTNRLPTHTHTLASGSTGSTGGGTPFDNRQPVLALNWLIEAIGNSPASVTPWTGELRLYAGFNSSVLGADWLAADGALYSASTYGLLNTAIGATYGGDGFSTVGVPDLRGRVTVGIGQGAGTSAYNIGQTAGQEAVTLTTNQIGAHTHSILIAPSVSCPGNITTNNALGQCAQTVAFSASVTAGSPVPTVSYKLDTNVITSPYPFPVGTNIVVATASNGVSPVERCSFRVIVNDTEPPTMICPSNITVTSDGGNCPKVVTFAAGATDNCGLTNLYAIPGTGSSFPVGTNTVRTYAFDAAGNSNSCGFTVTVLPGPTPLLYIGHFGTNVVVWWSNVFTCYTLEVSGQPAPTPPLFNLWVTHPGPFVTNGSNIYVTNHFGATNLFFRLSSVQNPI